MFFINNSFLCVLALPKSCKHLQVQLGFEVTFALTILKIWICQLVIIIGNWADMIALLSGSVLFFLEKNLLLFTANELNFFWYLQGFSIRKLDLIVKLYEFGMAIHFSRFYYLLIVINGFFFHCNVWILALLNSCKKLQVQLGFEVSVWYCWF